MKNREIFSEGTPLTWGKSNKQGQTENPCLLMPRPTL